MSGSITMSDTEAAPIEASDEVLAVHRKMQQRRQLNRALTYLVAAVLVLWILIPLWLLGSMAFTTPETVRTYPKGILPFIPFSFETMRFFLTSEGIIPGVPVNDDICLPDFAPGKTIVVVLKAGGFAGVGFAVAQSCLKPIDDPAKRREDVQRCIVHKAD